jgi:glycosyltransferase involved in cell wall biosynthesis
MKIGVDVTFALDGHRTGIYYHVYHSLRALAPIAGGPLALFANTFGRRLGRGRRAALEVAFDGLPIQYWPRPWLPYRLRSWFSPLRKLDVLYHNQSGNFPPLSTAANVYLVPDLIPLVLPVYEGPLRGSLREFCEAASKHGQAILVSTEYVKGEVARVLGVEPGRVHVTPLAAGPRFKPLPPEAFRPALAKVGLENTPYVLYVSTLVPHKNHLALVRAYARLRRREPALPHKLVLVGAKWLGYEPVFEAVRELGLEGQVLHLGYVDEPEAFYNGADLFAFPSLAEGFGLPPLEAMACGTPVVCSDATSLPEVVGDAALTVPPEDEEGLCEAMRRALTDRPLHAALRQKGLERAAGFSWERNARETLAACQRACQRVRG